jgi:hypothetical protein
MPKRSQGFTLTKNMGRGFILRSTLPTQWAVLSAPLSWRSLLRVLCPVRRPVITLDCILLKDKSLALVPRHKVHIKEIMLFLKG